MRPPLPESVTIKGSVPKIGQRSPAHPIRSRPMQYIYRPFANPSDGVKINASYVASCGHCAGAKGFSSYYCFTSDFKQAPSPRRRRRPSSLRLIKIDNTRVWKYLEGVWNGVKINRLHTAGLEHGAILIAF